MSRFRQTSIKISCSTEAELEQKVNSLGAIFDMGMTICPTMPDATDTQQWYIVNYWENYYE